MPTFVHFSQRVLTLCMVGRVRVGLRALVRVGWSPSTAAKGSNVGMRPTRPLIAMSRSPHPGFKFALNAGTGLAITAVYAT